MEIKYPVSAVEPGRVYSFPVAAGAVIQKGRLVGRSSTGFALPALDGPGYTFLGVARHSVDNSEGENGDKWITLYLRGLFEFDAISLAQTLVGYSMFAENDYTMAHSSITTYDVRIGRLIKFISETRGVVDIGL